MKLLIVEKAFGLDRKKKKLWSFEKLWIGSQAVDFWEALDWITRKWSCWLLRRLWIGSQEKEAVDFWEALDWQ
jgi:hypothetical protein